MHTSVKKIAVTGSAGQIAYSLLFKIANGDLFGKDQPIALHLLETPQGIDALKGVVMELQDCKYPLLTEVITGTEPEKLFEGVDVALLIGSSPRLPGMERKDLLLKNGEIFVRQGKALNQVAHQKTSVLVVGNPANTNCLIAMHHAPNISPSSFTALTMLDEQRAGVQLAIKAKVPFNAVEKVVIWGNHSATQVPDISKATINGRNAAQMIDDPKWIEEEFIPSVQKRGAAVLNARGKSSAASAAQAIIGSCKNILKKTEKDRVFSAGVLSTGNPYGVKEGLVFSFPCVCKLPGNVQIAEGFKMSPFIQEKIAITEKELIEEKNLIAHLLT